MLLLHPFNGLFSGTAWVSRHHKGKPFWILLAQEMMGWHWHQLDHMQVICTSIQTDNHAGVSACFTVYSGLLRFNYSDYVQTGFMPIGLRHVGTGRWKNEFYHSLLLKVIMLHKYWNGRARTSATVVVKTTFLSEEWRIQSTVVTWLIIRPTVHGIQKNRFLSEHYAYIYSCN